MKFTLMNRFTKAMENHSMWNKPWKSAEGFLIGGGLIVVGILLQLAAGPIQWNHFAWPVNIIVLIIFSGIIGLMYCLRSKVYLFEWMMHIQSAIPSIAYALGLTIIMGVTVQTDQGGIPWISQMLTFWPFVLIYTWVAMIAGLVTLKRIMHFKTKDIPFIINHLGLFMAMTCATLGNADMQTLRMTAMEGKPERRAVDSQGDTVELDLAIELHKFEIEEYPPQILLADHMEKKVLQEGEHAGWKIQVVKKLEEAAFVHSEGEIRYEPWNSSGATTAIFIKATKDDQSIAGWVSCGSYAFPAKSLPLNARYSVIMPERAPKRYTSDISIYTRDGQKLKGTVEVNKPMKADGWKVYQYSYDRSRGKWSETSIFELVKDPWLPAVYCGIFLMLAGALCLMLFMAPKPIKED